MCNKPIITHLGETLTFFQSSSSLGAQQYSTNQARQLTIQTFHYWYILTNKGINVHYLQVTYFSYQVVFYLLLVNESLTSHAD